MIFKKNIKKTPAIFTGQRLSVRKKEPLLMLFSLNGEIYKLEKRQIKSLKIKVG